MLGQKDLVIKTSLRPILHVISIFYFDSENTFLRLNDPTKHLHIFAQHFFALKKSSSMIAQPTRQF